MIQVRPAYDRERLDVTYGCFAVIAFFSTVSLLMSIMYALRLSRSCTRKSMPQPAQSLPWSALHLLGKTMLTTFSEAFHYYAAPPL